MDPNEGLSDYVKLTITTNLNPSSIDKRFSSRINLRDLKGKLELITGGNMATMQLELRNKDGDCVLSNLADDSKTLGEYGMEDGMVLNVTDEDTNKIDDESDVSFQLSEEEYARREESARLFLQKNKLGKYDETKIEKKQEEETRESALALSIPLNSRCQVRISGTPTRRGEVKYVGKVHFKPGDWVGVQYDEPVGKNNGTVEGKQYFDCRPKYGGFVRPSAVEVGDFPELGLEDLEEI